MHLPPLHFPLSSARRPSRPFAAVPRRSVTRLTVVGLVVATAGLVVAPNLSPVSLAGSSFEIDADANLVVDAVGKTDWGSLAHANPTDPEKRAADIPTGSNDNSYKGGVKEDTTCPGEETGSIPNNKSDLLTFHVYEEPGVGNHPGFLNLAWSRVTEPSGATLMDFEFNQGSLDVAADKCDVGPNVKRRAGDLLIEYGLASNGTSAKITKRTWTGSAWGTAVDLSLNDPACGNQPCAEGRVNTSAITAANSDDIGARSIRTFGEASLDLRAIFTPGQCAGFGTATLKSRAAESFTSQLKDFISPIKVNIDNCGSITVNKVTENGTGSFAFGATGTGLSGFSLGNGGTKVFSNLGAGSYTVDEDLTAGQIADGWTLKNLSCTENGAGTSASENAGTGVASITLANGGDVVCTYTNHRRLSPSISTSLVAGSQSGTDVSGSVGASVYDTATLTGATANAGGTVTYTVYTNSACTQGAQTAGTKNVTAGAVADSDTLVFNTPGRYYWQAVYSGDADNFGATSACTSEQLLIRNNPTITTLLNGTDATLSVEVGSSVFDSAMLTGASSDAGGSVTYTVYSNNACTQGSRDAGTKTVTNGSVPNSNSLAFNNAGTFYWQAVYTGDTNNDPATSACTAEVLTVQPKSPTATTAQDLLPNDTFTLSGGFNATGTVTFSLYAPGDANCSGTPAYTQVVPLSGGTTAATTNNSFHALTEGTWRWKVVYSGDNNNNGVTLACGVERFTVDND